MHAVLAGGGTAGHIEPALNLADALMRDDPNSVITMLGTEKGLESSLVPARGYALEMIPAVPLPRRPSPDLLSLPGRMRSAVAAVRHALEHTTADVVVGFGSYVALPAYLAARQSGTAFVVHEANAKPGLGNRLGARMTPFVAETVAGSLPHAVVTGLPLRQAIVDLNRGSSRAEAAAFFGLDPDLPTLLVFGGSQGAQSINSAIAAARTELADSGIQILQSVGARNEVPMGLSTDPVHVALAYIDRMDLAYAAADLALCRSGAMTVAELTAVGMPAAYVPFPIGNGEQRLNAEPVVRVGGGLVVDDAQLSAAWIRNYLIPLLLNQSALHAASSAAAGLGHRDADRKLVELVKHAASSGGGK